MTDIPEDVMKLARHAASHVRNNDDAAAVENIVARAIMRDRAAQAERMARLEEALRDIRDGRGKCKTCGTPATGGGAGFTDCDCVRPSWTPQDPADIAARALSQEGSDARAWPSGCLKPSSCERHKACMYVGCPNEGRDIENEVDAAILRAAEESAG